MRIDRAGVPFVLGALVPAGAAWWAGVPWLALGLAALAAGLALFFRDPERPVPADDAGMVLSPADGRVMVAGACQPGVPPPGHWQQISIFLSPLDVHINRLPYSGTVTQVELRRGRFLAAYKPESAVENERSEVWIQRGATTVVCRQIVGMLARRVVCRIAPGAAAVAGARFGLMKFGSRMDVFVPPDARILVSPGDRVLGGVTVIARLDGGR
ncbi:MAG: phosphatidylserine decarboxylase [Vicinamibacterales bacterium]